MREDIIQDRIKTVEQMRDKGVDPYPPTARRTHTIGDLTRQFAALKKSAKTVTIVGRVHSVRDQGNIVFVDVKDESGRMQCVLKKDTTKEYALYKKIVEVGDFVQMKGAPFVTKKKEKSVLTKECHVLTKALRPIPSDFYGLSDTETRLRKRYLDALTNDDVKALFEKKSRFWASIREYLSKEGFMEVDTPVLEAIPGGAEAEPFVTHHNALDEDFYLRISLEIALKKMMVAGFEKIYEVGRVFRNEGIDAEHLQDYTQMEFYWAYADYRDLMKFLPKLYRFVIKKTFGTLDIPWQGKTIHWGKEWKIVDYCKAFEKATGLNPLECSVEELHAKAKELSIPAERNLGKGRLVDLIYKKVIRPTLIQPVFLVNPPVFIEPLAKRSPNNPNTVERLQIVACGSELGKGFSEANDPQDQRERFEEQMRLRSAGDNEAQMLDEAFLEALEYGMPPTAGFGLSERLFAVLADKPIRETVFFPPMKQQSKE